MVREWRARCPWGRLVYRSTTVSAYGDREVQRRCDQLAREAEVLLPYGPVILEAGGWNEERQDDPLLAAYADDSCEAVRILRLRGYLVAVGGFSVQWPKRSGRALYLPAVREGDFFHFHTYSAPNLTDDWTENVGHGFELAEWVWREAGKKSLVTEFGIDWGVLGREYQKLGWRGGRREDGQAVPGISTANYREQLRAAALRAPRCIEALFVFAAGGIYGWQSFETAGEPELEQLTMEEYPVYTFELGFKLLADRMRERGMDPGQAIEPEQPRVFEDSWVITRQRTSTGTMLWLKDFNDMQFWGQDGKMVAYRGGALGIA